MNFTHTENAFCIEYHQDPTADGPAPILDAVKTETDVDVLPGAHPELVRLWEWAARAALEDRGHDAAVSRYERATA